MYYHKMPLDQFDNVMPWEKDIYVNMLMQKVEEENEKARLKESENRARRKFRR